MKFFIVLALCVAAATAFVIPPIIAGSDTEIQQIIDAINHPSTDPATAAALEDMLLEILGIGKPEPGVVEETVPVQVLPEIIDDSIVSEPANYQRPPVVQIIVNVNGNAAGNPVVVEQPAPGIVPEDVSVVDQPALVPEESVIVEKPVIPEAVIVAPIDPAPVIVPEEVSVVDQPAIVPEESVIVEKPVIPEPVIIAPIEPAPVITLPDTLN